MKDFLLLLKRFVPPYKKYLGLSIIMNILSALLNLLTFAIIKPILELLFKTTDIVYNYQPYDFSSFGSALHSLDALKNNFFWYISEILNRYDATTALVILALYLVGATVFRTLAMYLAFYFMIPVRTGVVRDIRNRINSKILSLPLAFFSEERKGDIIARISGDVNEIESSVMSSLDMLFKNPVLIIIYLIGMTVISWQLTLFVILVLPLAGYIMGQIGKKLKKTSYVGQQQWGYLMSLVEETLGGLRIIKAFNAEDKIAKRFSNSNETFRSITMGVFRRQQMAHPMSELLGTITIAIVLVYGGTLILDNNSAITGSSFIVYLTVFYLLINPAKDLTKSVYSIQKGLASLERVDKILKAESTIKDPVKPFPVTFEREIEYNNIWFRYSESWVIKNVSLAIERGKTIALVGQSGSGKSTLADLLPRFYDVEKGSITIDGRDIREISLRDLRKVMGIVSQDAILFNDSFYNNITFGVENATEAQVEEAARIANAHEFIVASEHGYHTNVGDRGCKLSGGQRQRISIARAVLKNPPLLILDEATSALDTESERLVQDALDRLMKNRTTLVIAHRLSTVRNADRICVMHEGEIVEQGSHEELISRDGYYRRLCEMQFLNPK
ncbi:MAG: ABC transporter ATP-binding protein/permease [Dysgonamonadaceae bacterium]|jgi:ATP-binding cassette subfamily B protein/subfamily B ATP-binding cassette protein MsbA|nr:ABC transporter ATP-binding protein/permease [Dysgonamonadaceae bacterium]